MKFLALILLSIPAIAQMPSPVFPARPATTTDLLTAANTAHSSLTAPIGTADTSIPVLSSGVFSVPTDITIDNEIIHICSVSGNSLVVCSSGRAAEGTLAATHSAGSLASQRLTALFHNQSAAETISIETKLSRELRNVLDQNTGACTGSSDDTAALTNAFSAVGVPGNGAQIHVPNTLPNSGRGPCQTTAQIGLHARVGLAGDTIGSSWIRAIPGFAASSLLTFVPDPGNTNHYSPVDKIYLDCALNCDYVISASDFQEGSYLRDVDLHGANKSQLHLTGYGVQNPGLMIDLDMAPNATTTSQCADIESTGGRVDFVSTTCAGVPGVSTQAGAAPGIYTLGGAGAWIGTHIEDFNTGIRSDGYHWGFFDVACGPNVGTCIRYGTQEATKLVMEVYLTGGQLSANLVQDDSTGITITDSQLAFYASQPSNVGGAPNVLSTSAGVPNYLHTLSVANFSADGTTNGVQVTSFGTPKITLYANGDPTIMAAEGSINIQNSTGTFVPAPTALSGGLWLQGGGASGDPATGCIGAGAAGSCNTLRSVSPTASVIAMAAGITYFENDSGLPGGNTIYNGTRRMQIGSFGVQILGSGAGGTCSNAANWGTFWLRTDVTPNKLYLCADIGSGTGYQKVTLTAGP